MIEILSPWKLERFEDGAYRFLERDEKSFREQTF